MPFDKLNLLHTRIYPKINSCNFKYKTTLCIPLPKEFSIIFLHNKDIVYVYVYNTTYSIIFGIYLNVLHDLKYSSCSNIITIRYIESLQVYKLGKNHLYLLIMQLYTWKFTKLIFIDCKFRFVVQKRVIFNIYKKKTLYLRYHIQSSFISLRKQNVLYVIYSNVQECKDLFYEIRRILKPSIYRKSTLFDPTKVRRFLK